MFCNVYGLNYDGVAECELELQRASCSVEVFWPYYCTAECLVYPGLVQKQKHMSFLTSVSVPVSLSSWFLSGFRLRQFSHCKVKLLVVTKAVPVPVSLSSFAY